MGQFRLCVRGVLRWGMTVGLLALLARAAGAEPPTDETRHELERQVRACAPDDAIGRVAIARWALDHGMPREAEALYRQVLSQNPEHDGAYDALIHLAQNRTIGRNSRRYRATRQALPDEFREYERSRFIVLSNASRRWSQAQLDRLSRAHHQFIRCARKLGLRPLPLRHKLVCVLFDDREDFAEFARREDGMADGWVLGYYSPRNDRIVFFNGEAQPGADDYTKARTIATTIHEGVHQLLFHTGVQSVHIQYPLWICEGLATSFETDQPNAAFGPGHEHEPRRNRFTELLRDDTMIPLRTLVQFDVMPDSRRETILAVYNQSYALVSWMARYRQRELRDYLRRMLREPPGRPTPERHLEIFIEAFGDVERLESRWLRDEQRWLSMVEPPERDGSRAAAAPAPSRLAWVRRALSIWERTS
jgi:hypothetical protein